MVDVLLRIVAILLALFGILQCSLSCEEKRDRKEKAKFEEVWRIKQQKEDEESEAYKKVYSDSVVDLSFFGLYVGRSVDQTIEIARSNGKVSDIRKNKEDGTITCKAQLILPDISDPVDVSITLNSFQDTVISMTVVSESYETREQLKQIYFDRYNEKAAQKSEKHTDIDRYKRFDNNDRLETDSWVWKFKNQELAVRELATYSSGSYSNKRFFENITIQYSDIYQCQKLDDYKQRIEEQKRLETDSIKNVLVREQLEQNSKVTLQDY